MAVTHPLEFVGSPKRQHAAEEIRYTLDVTEWGENPSSITVTAYDDTNADVTTTVVSGTATVVDTTTLLLPTLKALTAGTQYRVEVQFTTDAGNTLRGYFLVLCWATEVGT